MKIVINNCHGGFGLSEKAVLRYAAIKGITIYPQVGDYGDMNYFTVPPEMVTPPIEDWHKATPKQKEASNEAYKREHFIERDIERDDPVLVQVVEELGSAAASGNYGELKVVEVPDDAEWEIEEYDGSEWVAEKHRRWS